MDFRRSRDDLPLARQHDRLCASNRVDTRKHDRECKNKAVWVITQSRQRGISLVSAPDLENPGTRPAVSSRPSAARVVVRAFVQKLLDGGGGTGGGGVTQRPCPSQTDGKSKNFFGGGCARGVTQRRCSSQSVQIFGWWWYQGGGTWMLSTHRHVPVQNNISASG